MLSIVTMPYARTPELTHPITESLYPLTDVSPLLFGFQRVSTRCSGAVFFIFLACWGLTNFLDLWADVFHHIWGHFGHYFFQHSFFLSPYYSNETWATLLDTVSQSLQGGSAWPSICFLSACQLAHIRANSILF